MKAEDLAEGDISQTAGNGTLKITKIHVDVRGEEAILRDYAEMMGPEFEEVYLAERNRDILMGILKLGTDIGTELMPDLLGSLVKRMGKKGLAELLAGTAEIANEAEGLLAKDYYLDAGALLMDVYKPNNPTAPGPKYRWTTGPVRLEVEYGGPGASKGGVNFTGTILTFNTQARTNLVRLVAKDGSYLGQYYTQRNIFGPDKKPWDPSRLKRDLNLQQEPHSYRIVAVEKNTRVRLGYGGVGRYGRTKIPQIEILD